MKRICAWLRDGFLVPHGMMRSHDPAFMLGLVHGDKPGCEKLPKNYRVNVTFAQPGQLCSSFPLFITFTVL